MLCTCALHINFGLQRFDVAGDKGISDGIADGLRRSSSLLECAFYGIDNVAWCRVFDALRDNPQNQIVDWKLANHGINASVAKSLAAYMAVSTSLTEVCVCV